MPFPDWGADGDTCVNIQALFSDAKAEVGKRAGSDPAPDQELGPICTDHLFPLRSLS